MSTVMTDSSNAFAMLAGQMIDGHPAIYASVFRTAAGTPYLRVPGVVMLSKPDVNIRGLKGFLDGFDPSLKFSHYLDDPVTVSAGVQLTKVAGQVCYASYGPGRTRNENASKYVNNLVSSGHGSVLEHANYTLLFYGVSRSMTHEFVRHRAGWGFSQLSQRYVSGRVLRFVERPEYQEDDELHRLFETRIDLAAKIYNDLTEKLMARQKEGTTLLSAEQKTDLRKKVQQAARSVLTNETETVIVATANARAWRHVCYMRANRHAEVEIREALFRAFLCLHMVDPILFEDFQIEELPDRTRGVTTQYPKV